MEDQQWKLAVGVRESPSAEYESGGPLQNHCILHPCPSLPLAGDQHLRLFPRCKRNHLAWCADCRKTEEREKECEVREEMVVYSSEYFLACLFFPSMTEQMVYIDNTKSIPSLHCSQKSLPRCSSNKGVPVLFTHHTVYSDLSSALLSDHFGPYTRILIYSIQTRYIRSSSLRHKGN